jgi:serine phosphatase RsbU (regulator of sigma subunit)
MSSEVVVWRDERLLMSVSGSTITTPRVSVGISEEPEPPVRVKMARFVAASLMLRANPLWKDINTFSGWFENECRVINATGNREAVRIEISCEGFARLSDGDELTPLQNWRRLWSFLADFGIRHLELDPRLESNQVSDVLTLIFDNRRDLRRKKPRSMPSIASQLRSARGITFACAVTRIEDDALIVDYSYCMTRFSRVVAWFKKRQRHLQDHRALFRAAPRYGVVLGLAPLGVFLLYYVNGGFWPLLITSAIAAAGVFGTTYLFFMTIGSLVYDNEEKAFRLAKANRQLRLYADWIHGDLERARVVQQMLLPDFNNMPMTDRLEWGASFIPEEEVGGDYFDAANLDETRVAVLFADVSGHGLSAALITAIIKATFQSWTERDGSIEDFVRQLNRRLFNLTPPQSFAAVATGIFNLSTMEFVYCNCGHNPEPYLIRSQDGRPTPLCEARNLILGALEDFRPTTARLCLQTGDTVFFATDGITEATNPYGEEYEIQRLEDFLANHKENSLHDMVDCLIKDVESHMQNSGDNDDRAVLAFRVR